MDANGKPKGAGSLWNPNSWHWEAKDYTSIAKQLIEKKIQALTVNEGGIKITNQCKNIKGDAQVNIRKGKQVLVYDFDIEIEWQADSDADDAKGTFKIKDLNSMDPDVEVVGLQATTKTPISDQSKDIVKKHVFPRLKETFSTLLQELAQFESDQSKLKEDELRRQLLAEEVARARELTGEEKERIFQEQKRKDEEMKAQYSQWKDK